MKIKKTPSVLQFESVECGAACLSMILKFYGRHLPLEDLRSACGVSRDGSKASNIIKAARIYGLNSNGFKIDTDDLLLEKNFPYIIHWNFNHFVVLEGIKNNKFYLNDPAYGPRVVDLDDFNDSFTGVLLEFSPSENFEKNKSPSSFLKNIFDFIETKDKPLILFFFISLCSALLNVLIPALSKLFVDYVILKKIYNWFYLIILGMIFTFIIRFIINYIRGYLLNKLNLKIAVINSSNFISKIFNLPMEFFTQRSVGDIAARMSKIEKISESITSKLVSSCFDFVLSAIYLILMFLISPHLSILVLFLTFINLLILINVSKKRKYLNQNIIQESSGLMGSVITGMDMIETLKATGAEEAFFSRWTGIHARKLNLINNLESVSIFITSVPILINGILNVLILTVGAMFIIDGFYSMSIGSLIAFQSLMSSFLTPLNNILMLLSDIQDVSGEIMLVEDLYAYPKSDVLALQPSASYSDYQKLKGFVELSNVHFGYSILEEPLIKNFSLSIKPGQMIALVGPSGSGKSTVSKLICGLYSPLKGSILLDKIHLSKIDRASFSSSVAIVNQDISLFEASIYDNISLWDSSIPRKDIIDAAKDAKIHDDILRKAGGYSHILSENGKNLSGGQRQRIEIARALCRKPSILILDEATSALDPKVEKDITDMIKKRGCTCIIIAHRLSTIRDCDEILVLERGIIKERGSHEQLLLNGDIYKKLISND